MKNKIYIAIIGVAIIGIIFFVLKNNDSTGEQSQDNSSAENKKEASQPKADKIEVFYFHSANRCVACVTLSKYTAITISKNFQEEISEGKIDFQEINVDLSENKELAKKFQAVGSSLFINAIYEDQNHIKEDAQVWRLLNNQAQFENYLKNKIDNLLGA
jgi:thiol-disulfide isomerase/thioredoxin